MPERSKRLKKPEKHILEQYTDLRAEERDLVRRIQSLTDQILSMEMSGYRVADSVACGKKGKKPIRTVKIEGFPHPDYEKKKAALKRYKHMLEDKDQELLAILGEVEEYIEGIQDARIRRILRHRYIDDMTWQQVAYCMGRKHTADGCRMSHDRFMQEGK